MFTRVRQDILHSLVCWSASMSDLKMNATKKSNKSCQKTMELAYGACLAQLQSKLTFKWDHGI